jgi:predicted lipoprotein with Yx(FWY)xxD motif
MPANDRVAPRAPSRRRGRISIALATLGAGMAAFGVGLATAPGASAQTVQARPATSAVVVATATRGSFGKILVTTKGLALYEHPKGSCTGTCLTVWPPLLMPKGATTPEGASGLGTVKVGGGRLQVTYHKQPLYTFDEDSGTSVKGNGIDGFVVAKVS